MVFSSSHFLFSTAEFFNTVPNAPTIIDSFDEFNTALRAWTRGWDIYMLPRQAIAHRFQDKNKEQSLTLWQDKPEMNRYGVLGAQRYLHLINKEVSDHPEIIRNAAKYGLGTKRSLKSFEQYSGLNLTQNSTELFTDFGLASKERILPDGRSALLAPVQAGHNTLASQPERHKLVDLLKSMEVAKILDIGCMRQTCRQAATV